MQTINIAIVDDNYDEQENLCAFLKDYASANHLQIMLSRFKSGEEFLDGYSPYLYTVIFLDIYMSGISGIDTAKKIREADRDTLVVFLTSSDDHMMSAWRVHAYEYILKPVKKEQVFMTMDDILDRTTSLDSKRFSFTSQKQQISILFSDLVSVTTDLHNYLEITDKTGETWNTRMTFNQAQEQLSSDPRFLLLRRGVLVNMDYITGFSNDVCQIEGGIQIPIIIRSRKKIEQTWQNYLLNKIRDESLRRRKHS